MIARNLWRSVGVVLLLSAWGSVTGAAQVDFPDPEIPLCAKPVLSLVVKDAKLSVGKQGATVSFAVYAIASGGFQGTVSGTITVAQPFNPNRIALILGNDSQTFPFTLAAGESTSSTCRGGHKNCFVITTAANNMNAGNLVYTIFLDPSTRYSAGNGLSLQQITVMVP